MNKKSRNRLISIKLQNDRMKYPSVPEHCLPIPSYSDASANGLTKCIIDFLNLSGHQAERINTTGRPKDSRKIDIDVIGRARLIGSVQWIKGTGRKGSADISSTIKGRSVKWEVKIGKDRQSEAQKEYQLEVEKAEGFYYIAHNFDDFLKTYDELMEKLS